MKPLDRHSEHYTSIYDWVKSYVPNEDEAMGLTNQLHWLSVKHSKRTFVMGLVMGGLGVLALIAWLS